MSGKIYIGQTVDLDKRLKQHNERIFLKKSYTKLNKGEWIVVYQEESVTRSGALKREKELKSYRGREYIKKVISGR